MKTLLNSKFFIKTKEKLSLLWRDYGHGIIFLYALIYLPWFAFLENHVTRHFHVVHMVLDDYIPFVEYFVIPYLFWFVYISATGLYLFLTNKEDFKRYGLFICVGMTIFLIISTVYPNGAYLRPIVFPRDNFCTDLVKLLYSQDTATNLFPSLHVYNAIGAHLALRYNSFFRGKKPFIHASSVCCILIVLSTMFIKQHSVFDVLMGIFMALGMWLIVYAPFSELQKKTVNNKKEA